MATNPKKLSQFWQELKRRNVVRVVTVYAGAAFVIIELINNITEPLHLPEWTPTLVIVLLAIGFPVVIIFSWIYDVHPEGGMVKTEPAYKIKPENIPKTSNRWKIASYISFVVIVGLIILNVIPRNSRSEVKEILDKSIAVLPFINDSEDKGNEHIINGIMEEILINLQSIKELRVPGRISVEQYRNNPKSIPEIASEMNVAYIVEGSGQKYGNKIRLRVQLVEGGTDKHIWADSYDEEINKPEDIFTIQSKIAMSIAAELQAVITPEEIEIIEKVPTTNLTAYDFYQKGEEERRKYSSDDKLALERAEDLYRYALEEDSTFALAYIGLAHVYQEKHFWETYLLKNFLDSMLILADIALSFDDQLAEAYIMKGNYYRQHNNKEKAITEFNKAIKYNPNEWQAYNWKGKLYEYDDLVNAIDNFQKAASLNRGPDMPELYRQTGRAYATAGFKEIAIYYENEALKLDGDSAAYFGDLSEIEDANNNFKKAIEFGKKSYTFDSTDYWVIFLLGYQHMYLGQYEKSLDYLKKYQERIKTLGNLHPWGTIWVGYAYWINGFKDEAENYFNKALEFYNELIQLDRFYIQDLHTYYSIAALHAFLGDKDKAYEYLKLMNQRQRMPIWVIKDIKNDPHFDPIRDEPEFQQIVRDVEAKYQAEHERVRRWMEENDML